ncbi:Lysine exporter protein (LYSE/YGGA) [Ferrimonas balearica DSM 9799]|uniref:Lysine exporter protein (LYSE/YGGA) n=1 Tax=Ferrimonas balearica (strain DSM 9799 / CCM 4581 / KCTC 23876 / PAT) TaxID=550540 RepID=E1SR71_FERBD|nr:LysE family translocator [Ferrimonas balearica]ADN74836.1 Lysine exporter protein (LYSE/YGGA) [Ferrimonas balearica DSM 9799]MBW3140637.1 LysE family translocator [Ferrimonas balearica]MBW3165386.1 LysE family translocator [Ferrimonas balearica]MBY5981404.1 LysE family translocator [Ferrimonas balearica]MBY6107558.1 LysE family translocator [Ferrimonas balearica]
MIDTAVLLLFIPTFFTVAITPGMCMLLALSLGMSIGVRRTLPMMAGELLGVAMVSLSAVLGVAALMLNLPMLFTVLKMVGGAYLLYLGIQMWRSEGRLGKAETVVDVTARGLFLRGWLTAIANPKGWAFMIALLPPFISAERPLLPQLSILVAIILACELSCMLIYASGGSTLRRLLSADKVQWINRLAGTMMAALGVWLMVE